MARRPLLQRRMDAVRDGFKGAHTGGRRGEMQKGDEANGGRSGGFVAASAASGIEPLAGSPSGEGRVLSSRSNRLRARSWSERTGPRAAHQHMHFQVARPGRLKPANFAPRQLACATRHGRIAARWEGGHGVLRLVVVIAAAHAPCGARHPTRRIPACAHVRANAAQKRRAPPQASKPTDCRRLSASCALRLA